MLSKKSLPLSAKIYIKLRPLICPFDLIEKNVPGKGTVVDIGCGYGIFAHYMSVRSKERNVIGIDLNEKRISQANQLYGNLSNLRFICNNITSSEIPNADIITAVDVFHHIPSLELQIKLLQSCFSVLQKNGKLIVKDLDIKPRWKYWWNKIHDYIMTKGEPVLYNDQNTMKELIKKTGFELEKSQIFTGQPYAHVIYVAKKL